MTHAAPSARQIVGAIARREIGLASRRKLVRLLFLASVLPPIVLTVVILVRIFAEQMTGMELGFDPLLRFLQFQSLPVALIAIGLGTPIVALDRAEDVLFLYATRPVQPWHYALGKMLAVGGPAFGLFLFPGLLIAILRLGITRELDGGEATVMVLKIVLVGFAAASGYAGLTVGPSALVKKARWAELLAVASFLLPGAMAQIVAGITRTDPLPIGPIGAVHELLTALFDDGGQGILAFLVLLAWGAIGFAITAARVRREMIP